MVHVQVHACECIRHGTHRCTASGTRPLWGSPSRCCTHCSCRYAYGLYYVLPTAFYLRLLRTTYLPVLLLLTNDYCTDYLLYSARAAAAAVCAAAGRRRGTRTTRARGVLRLAGRATTLHCTSCARAPMVTDWVRTWLQAGYVWLQARSRRRRWPRSASAASLPRHRRTDLVCLLLSYSFTLAACFLTRYLLACLLNPSPRKYWLTEAQAKQVEALGLRRRLVEAHATAYGAAAPSTVEEVLALSLRLRQHGAWAEAMVRALLRDAVALPPVRVCPCVCRLHAAQWVQVAGAYPTGSGCNPILPVYIGADAGAARGVPLLARRGARADAPHRARARGGCIVVVAVVVQGVVAIE